MGMMYFEDLNVGDSWTSAEYTVDPEKCWPTIAEMTHGQFTSMQRQPVNRRSAD